MQAQNHLRSHKTTASNGLRSGTAVHGLSQARAPGLPKGLIIHPFSQTLPATKFRGTTNISFGPHPGPQPTAICQKRTRHQFHSSMWLTSLSTIWTRQHESITKGCPFQDMVSHVLTGDEFHHDCRPHSLLLTDLFSTDMRDMMIEREGTKETGVKSATPLLFSSSFTQALVMDPARFQNLAK